jgi:TM2 domain-containing membrane protein YozV
MYCPKCGKELNGSQEFCGNCGNRVGLDSTTPYQQQQVVYQREKSAGLAAVLSFIWPGLGHLYIGKLMIGLLLLLVYPVILFFGFIVLIIAAGLVGLLLIGVVYLAVLGWSIFNAYQLANEYNDTLRRTGNRPW